jgi:hypothetical protein
MGLLRLAAEKKDDPDGGKFRAERITTMGGVDALEFEVDFPDGKDILRACVANKRMYTISVRASPAVLASPDVQAFFKSFQITNP